MSTESFVLDRPQAPRARSHGARARPTAARSPQPLPRIIHPSEFLEKNTRTLAALLDALTEVGAKHALIGGLVAGYYGKGRATVDVDLLVPKRFMKRLQAAMKRRGYEVRTFPDMMRMYVPGEPESVGDLLAQEGNPVLRAAFMETTSVAILGLQVSTVRRGVAQVGARKLLLDPTDHPRGGAHHAFPRKAHNLSQYFHSGIRSWGCTRCDQG